MANRYWVGGTNTWNSTVGTKWALTSGGAGGQAIPTSADDVFFDAASGAVTCTISTGNTGAKSITCTGFTGTLAGTASLSVSGSVTLVAGMGYTYTGLLSIFATGTLTTAGKTLAALTLSTSGGTVSLGSALTLAATNILTLSGGAFNLNGFSCSAGQFSSTTTNFRSIAFGSQNISLTSTTASTTVLSMGTASNFTWTGTGGFTRNMAATATVAFGLTGGTASNAPNLTVNAGAATLSIAMAAGPTGSIFKNINFTGFTGTAACIPQSGYYYLRIAGNLTLGSGTYVDIDPTFVATGALVSNGRTIGQLYINGVGITVTLNDALAAQDIFLYEGTFTTSNFNISTGTVRTFYPTPKILNMGSSVFTITGNEFEVFSAPDYVVNSGTSTINMNSASAKTFKGANQTFYNLNQGGAGALTITGSNTFNDFTSTLTTASTVVSFTGGTTQTFANFTYSNTAPYTTTLQSASAGSTFTLSKASGTVNASRLLISNSIATGGATWNATDSVDLGNNTGWNFTASTGRYWVGGTASWDGTANTKWATASGGAGGATAPGSVDPVYFDAASGANTVTIATGNMGCAGFVCTGFTGTLTGTAALSVNGNVTLVSGMTYAYTGLITLAYGTITSAGKTFGSITVSSPGAPVTISGALTLGAANTFTLTSGTLSLGGTLSAGIFSSSNNNTRSISFGTNNIALTSTTASATVLSMAIATNFTFTGTGGFTRDQAASATVTFGTTNGTVSNAPNLTVNAGASNLTMTSSSWWKNINFTGSICIVAGNPQNFAGSITLGGGTYTNFGGTCFASGTITCAGKTLGGAAANMTINGSGITVDLGDAYSGNILFLTQGTFTTNNFNVTLASTFSSSNSNVRAVNMGSSTFTLAGVNFVLTTSTNMTLNSGTSTITMISALTKTFNGGSLTYYNLNVGGAGSLTITGSNTFNNITNSVQPATVTFTAGTTQTVSNFGLSGTAGNLITINSSTPGAQATLSKAYGQVAAQYLSIQDSNATGGAAWYAGATSTNVSNNTGWLFANAPSGNMFWMFI